MDLEAYSKIFNQIETTNLTDLKDELFRLAIRYARIRVDWKLADQDEKGNLERTRTFAHNAMIDACNILSRNMGNQGENNSWLKFLGDDRRIIGDFACYIHFILGVQAR